MAQLSDDLDAVSCYYGGYVATRFGVDYARLRGRLLELDARLDRPKIEAQPRALR